MNPDLLDLLAGEPSLLRHAARLRVEAICRDVATRDGDFDASRVRPLLPIQCIGPIFGATITAMVRSGLIVPTGRFAMSGNTAQRNGMRPVNVYKFTRKGWLAS